MDGVFLRRKLKTRILAIGEAFSRALSLQAENGFLEKERTRFAFGFAKYKAVFEDRPPSKTKRKRTPTWCPFVLAGDLGFEPRHTESESAVLPLHKSPMPYKYSTMLFPCQEIF